MNLKNQDREYYLNSSHASDYDKRTLSERGRKRIGATVATVQKYTSGGDIIDIGCGPARMLIAIAQAIPNAKLIGIDISPEMISIAEANVAKESLKNRISLTVQSAEELSKFDSSCFDLAMSHGNLSGWLNPQSTLHEIYRILRPGGVCILMDWNRSSSPETLKPYIEEANGQKDRLERIKMAFESSLTTDELREIISKSAFSIEEFEVSGIWMTAILIKKDSLLI